MNPEMTFYKRKGKDNVVLVSFCLLILSFDVTLYRIFDLRPGSVDSRLCRPHHVHLSMMELEAPGSSLIDMRILF